jgi:hypothetical protein
MNRRDFLKRLAALTAFPKSLYLSASDLWALWFWGQVVKAAQKSLQRMGVLARVGVSFTPSQTAMIEELVEAGRTQEAQSIILERLDQEFS